MSDIKSINAREILDSRGNPTLEVDVILADNSLGRFAVPSGASTGEHEALELRDQEAKRYNGKGVQRAVLNVVEQAAPHLIGIPSGQQGKIDNILLELDGTANKEVLGANVILGISMAAFKADCESNKKPFYQNLNLINDFILPVPLINVINGGAHANNGLDIQEFMIVPYGAPSFLECLRYASEIFHSLKKVLESKGYSSAVGDEGGFAPALKSNEEALDLLILAIEKAGYVPNEQIGIALDVAASELYDSKQQKYLIKNKQQKSSSDMIDWLQNLVNNYPIISIEDGLDQNDWNGWQYFTKKLGNKIQIVGDDLFVTNPKLIQKGIAEDVANAVLIKPNQIGTLTETLEAIALAQKANYNTVISHRSGETEDVTIADLAVATKSSQIKTGSVSRSERVAKYNRLLRIEEELGNGVTFYGKNAFTRWLK